MCILLYIKVLQCSGVLEVYGQLEEGRYICPRDMCILLYVKLICCSGAPEISGQL